MINGHDEAPEKIRKQQKEETHPFSNQAKASASAWTASARGCWFSEGGCYLTAMGNNNTHSHTLPDFFFWSKSERASSSLFSGETTTHEN